MFDGVSTLIRVKLHQCRYKRGNVLVVNTASVVISLYPSEWNISVFQSLCKTFQNNKNIYKLCMFVVMDIEEKLRNL